MVRIRLPLLFYYNHMEDKFSNEEWETCLKVLNCLKDAPFNNPDNLRFKTLITAIYKQAKKEVKKEAHNQKKSADNILLQNTTVIANAQNNVSLFEHKEEGEDTIHTNDLQIARRCYCCDAGFTQLHFFYHKLCPACAQENYAYRTLERDFTNHTVIITGGRVKIGYAATLKFLRLGATVVVTTRFPALALQQLEMEKDYDEWKGRLTVYGLDLRNLKAVEGFITYCEINLKSVDILVNNAAQTIKYPFEYYKPLLAKERQILLKGSNNSLIANTTPIAFKQEYLLPAGTEAEPELNRFGQPVDYREKNSWNATLTDVGLEELLEVNLINHISPYRLISGLKELMLGSPNKERFIINVTSSEGQFSYSNKTVFHPHTNMTKAALNMLTRTAAAEFVKEGIYMTAVDVGWISTGANEAKRAQQFSDLKIPPLDPLDGAMRIIHPIDEVLKGNTSLYGVLLKNYKVVNW
jgi:NAD(P)-dependent dehydrogenase (short-subunit alcohol dehydrogenase family)